MSFTTDVISELLEAPLPKTCCRKAILYGMFFGANRDVGNIVRAEFRTRDVACKVQLILKSQFSLDTDIKEIARAGRRFFAIEAKSKAISNFLEEIDSDSSQKSLEQIVGVRCPECSHSFLRGVFISLGTVNDPNKGYHLEFSLRHSQRAKLLYDFLVSEMLEPKIVVRGEKQGLYYKSSSSILNVLYYMGGVKSSFEIPNAGLMRDLRNVENRATNCVTSNISRAVEASRKQLEAIEILKSSGAFDRLSDDLRYTAELRFNNPSAPLSELALMHEPPISKSGLNRRITKLIEESKK